jgi:hypothetical protein
MRHFFLAAASALLLAACASPQQRAAQMQAEMDRIMTEYGPACAKLGYQPNSDAWRNCVIQLSTKDDILRYGFDTRYYGHPHWGGGMWGPW